MLDKEPGQVTGSYPETIGELVDISSIERSFLDQGERTFDGRLGTLPGRTEWSCFGTASETGSEAGALGGCCATIKPYIARQGRSHRTHGPAIDAGRSDRHEDHAVPCGVATSKSFILVNELKHDAAILAASR
jgi:hypothetical protein